MFQSPHHLEALVDAKIADLYAGTRSTGGDSARGRAPGFIAAARRQVGRAVIAVGARIAGGDSTTTRPAAPAHFAA
jgi:hypothetical protein